MENKKGYIKICSNGDIEINDISTIDLYSCLGLFIDFMRKKFNLTKDYLLEMTEFSFKYDCDFDLYIKEKIGSDK